MTRAQSCRADAACRWKPGISRSTAMGRSATAETGGASKHARLRAAGIPVSYQDIYGSDPNEAAIAELAVAFTSGDEAVTACLQRYGMDLCCAIVSLVNLLDVRAVRLGGFPYLLGEPFAELLRSILAEKFHILTSTGALNLQLFDCKYEDVRKAAVLQTLEAIFSKH